MRKLFGLCLSTILFWTCLENSNPKHKILQQNCGGCHITPEADNLTSEIWQHSVLPHMADYFVWDSLSQFDYANKKFYNKKARLPMTDKLWSIILDHYVNNGLKEVTLREQLNLAEQKTFHITKIDSLMDVPAVQAVNLVDEHTIAYTTHHAFHLLDLQTKEHRSFNTMSIVLDFQQLDDRYYYFLDAGEMRPHDAALGALKKYNLKTSEEETLVASLRRPVYMMHGTDGLYISEFGHQTGQISKLDISNNYKKSNLLSLPGCYKIIEADIDNDGNKEILAQCSQALEGIYRIDNQTNAVRKLIAFPPEYGLSDMELADVNNDGLIDILIALGDNADYSNIPKEYHGIRVFINRAKEQFREVYSFDAYGTTQLLALHLNGDDFIDFVSLSFFPVTGQASILVFENQGKDALAFDVSAVQESLDGRWMNMGSGDLQGDGDVDIVLGGYVEGPTVVDSMDMLRWIEESVDVLLLENLLY